MEALNVNCCFSHDVQATTTTYVRLQMISLSEGNSMVQSYMIMMIIWYKRREFFHGTVWRKLWDPFSNYWIDPFQRRQITYRGFSKAEQVFLDQLSRVAPCTFPFPVGKDNGCIIFHNTSYHHLEICAPFWVQFW